MPLIIRYGHRYRVHRSVIFNLVLSCLLLIFLLGPCGRLSVIFREANVCFCTFLEPVVTAWQAGYESLLTGRLVPQLVAAEENRTSCQASGPYPTFASAAAILSPRIRI